MNVFVTDGDQRATLAVVRSLGRQGLTITVGEARPHSLASSSKYCTRRLVYPSPEANPVRFQEVLRDFLQSQSHEILIPMTDVTCSLVAEIAQTLAPHAAVALPNPDSFAQASDKVQLLHLAQSLEIPVPRTEVIDDLDAVARIGPHLTYPVVLKPRHSRLRTSAGWVHGSVAYAHSPENLLNECRKMRTAFPFLLVQERIVGPGCGVFALFAHGVPKALFAHRRIREKPPSGGVSVLRESILLDDRLRDYACRLLEALHWHGVAMVEFKLDRRDAVPKLMEINGRFWGSLQLAIDAGVDFPYLLYQVMRGEDPPSVSEYRQGVRTRWFLGDLDHLLTIWLHRRARLSLPDGYPGRLTTLWEFCKTCGPSTRTEIWSNEDPGPALAELKQYVAAGLRGIWSRFA